MRSNLTLTKTLALAMPVLLAMIGVAQAQDAADLVKQLSGKAEAPARSVAQLSEAYQKAIDYLLPLMSAEDVGSRYNYQIMLQDMGSHAARPGAEPERETLAKVMIANLERASMPDTVRHWFVLQLERIGGGESVPALAKLMKSPDQHLRDYARRALEKNPDPSATEALLKELTAAQDSTGKIGLLNALGQRHALEAVGSVGQALNDADPKVAVAAAAALSNIGGEDSGRAFADILDKPVGPVTVKAAQALADIAQELVRQKNYSAGAQIYEFLYRGATKRASDANDFNPFNIRAAALNGLAVCWPDRLASRIPGVIQDDDPKIRAAAVQAARLAPTKLPMRVLSQMLPNLGPEDQVRILGLIADRGDLSFVKYAKEALGSDDESVRLAAIEALASIGSEEGAEAILETAAQTQGAAQKAALRGLSLMVGPRVEETIAAHAASGEMKSRIVAIGLLSKRRMPGATETLLGYATDENEDVRLAAFKALVDVADLVDIGALAALVVESKPNAVRRSSIAALEAALAKATDKDATANVLVSRMRTSDADAKVALLACLDALGGAAALDAVVEAAQSSDEALRDAAIRTLGNWPDFEAAQKLLAIASKPETSLTHYVLAMRGALRLIGTSNSAPLEDRVALCFQAFDQSRRDDEKRQAIATMASLPSPKVAERLLGLAKEGSLKVEAGLAAVELAGRSLRTDRQAARDLAQKVRDLDISDEVNRRADAVIRGRRGR